MVLVAWVVAASVQGVIAAFIVALAARQIFIAKRDPKTRQMHYLNASTSAVLATWSVDPYAAFGVYNWVWQVVFVDVIEMLLLISGVLIVDRIIEGSYSAERKARPVFLSQVKTSVLVLTVVTYALDPVLLYITDTSRLRVVVHMTKLIILVVFGGIAAQLIKTLLKDVRLLIQQKLLVELENPGTSRTTQRMRIKFQKVERKLSRTMWLFCAIIFIGTGLQLLILFNDLFRDDNGFKEQERRNKFNFNPVDVVVPLVYMLILGSFIYYSWVSSTPNHSVGSRGVASHSVKRSHRAITALSSRLKTSRRTPARGDSTGAVCLTNSMRDHGDRKAREIRAMKVSAKRGEPPMRLHPVNMTQEALTSAESKTEINLSSGGDPAGLGHTQLTRPRHSSSTPCGSDATGPVGSGMMNDAKEVGGDAQRRRSDDTMADDGGGPPYHEAAIVTSGAKEVRRVRRPIVPIRIHVRDQQINVSHADVNSCTF